MTLYLYNIYTVYYSINKKGTGQKATLCCCSNHPILSSDSISPYHHLHITPNAIPRYSTYILCISKFGVLSKVDGKCQFRHKARELPCLITEASNVISPDGRTTSSLLSFSSKLLKSHHGSSSLKTSARRTTSDKGIQSDLEEDQGIIRYGKSEAYLITSRDQDGSKDGHGEHHYRGWYSGQRINNVVIVDTIRVR